MTIPTLAPGIAEFIERSERLYDAESPAVDKALRELSRVLRETLDSHA